MSSARVAEARPVVAYQGEPGAFSEEAIFELWGGAAGPLPCATFAAVTEAVLRGRAAYGVVPVANSTAGPVTAGIAALEAAALPAVGSHALRIRLSLLALPGATLDRLESVQSHPVALAQCRDFLGRHRWLAPREAFDTAGAARLVAEAGNPLHAAIASVRAGRIHGLVPLAEGIEDRDDNVTRFTIVARDASMLPSRALAGTRPPANLEG